MSDSLQPFWTVSHQAPVSMGFFRQECWKKKKKKECWSGLAFPPSGDLPYSWFKLVSPTSPALQADSLPTEPLGKPLNFLLRSNETGFLCDDHLSHFIFTSGPQAFISGTTSMVFWGFSLFSILLCFFITVFMPISVSCAHLQSKLQYS